MTDQTEERPGVCNAEYPKEMDADLAWILGRPNFACSTIAGVLRDAGAEIARSSEAEQAAVIHWMIGLYLAHGRDWRKVADDELRRLGTATK